MDAGAAKPEDVIHPPPLNQTRERTEDSPANGAIGQIPGSGPAWIAAYEYKFPLWKLST